MKSGFLAGVRLRVTGKWLANICTVSAPATFRKLEVVREANASKKSNHSLGDLRLMR